MTSTDSLTRRLLSGTLWAASAKFFSVLAAFILNALLARLLSPGDLGVFFLLFSLSTFAGLLARFGLNQTVVRLVSEALALKQPGRAKSALTKILVICAFGAGVTFLTIVSPIGAWFASDVLRSEALTDHLWILALWAVALTFQTPIAEAFRGFKRLGLSSWFSGAVPLVALTSIIGLYWVKTDEHARLSIDLIITIALGTYVSAVLFAFVILFIIWRKLPGGLTYRYFEILKMSIPIYIINIVGALTAQYSLWVVSAIGTDEEVALFGAASKLVQLVLMPLVVVNMVVSPWMVTLYAQKNRTRLTYLLRQTATLAAIPSFTLLIAFILLGEQILSFIYGSAYGAAQAVLAILCIGYFFNAWSGSCGNLLMMSGNERPAMIISVSTAILLVLSTTILGNLYGVNGIAVATSITVVVQSVSFWHVAKIKTEISTSALLSPLDMADALRVITKKIARRY